MGITGGFDIRLGNCKGATVSEGKSGVEDILFGLAFTASKGDNSSLPSGERLNDGPANGEERRGRLEGGVRLCRREGGARQPREVAAIVDRERKESPKRCLASVRPNIMADRGDSASRTSRSPRQTR